MSQEQNNIEYKSGEKYILIGHQHCINRTKIHIISIIEDAGRIFIIYKWYGKHKQWWHYEMKEKWWLDMFYERDQLKRSKR